MDRIMKLMAAVLLSVVVVGCSSQAGGRAKYTSGPLPDLEFSMTDDTGSIVSADNYRGKVVLLFFGYTHCPDTCLTTLARLAEARRAARDHGEGSRVLFVTVDPARDSLSRLSAYVKAFGPGIIGLRGAQADLQRLARRCRVSYSIGQPNASGNYAVSHSSGVFVFDGAGRARLLVHPEDSIAAITADLDRVAGYLGDQLSVTERISMWELAEPSAFEL